MQITTDTGPSFFIRTTYLKVVKENDIIIDAEFLEEAENDLLNAGFCFACERKALDYLSRREQSRFLLTQKLLSKDFSKQSIQCALDYLEQKNYLSDERFATSWLNTRKITKAEGRIRLLSELLSRGIDKVICNKALDEFFEENSEEKICLRAIQKYKRLSKSEDKMIPYLIRCGFTNKIIQQVLSDKD